jgi:acetyl esterase/lipase
VSVEYRLTGEAQFPAQIEDCKAAIRWLHANAEEYGIDPERIGVWGHSAGGHLAALLGTSGGVEEFEGGGDPEQPSHVQAVVDCFGPTDLLRMDDFPGNITHNAPDSPESLLVGGPIQEHPDRVAAANPITYVDAEDPPFLILHGERDRLVPVNQSELLNEALQTAGVDSTFVRVKEAGHGFSGNPDPGRREIQAMIQAFFDEHLRSE